MNQTAALPQPPPSQSTLVPTHASQAAPTMTNITAYQPRTAPVQLTPFGVPMSQPSQVGSSRQPRTRVRRGAANQEPTAARSRRLVLKITLVLFPRDVSSNSYFLE